MPIGKEIERQTVIRQDNVERPVILIQDGIEYHDEIVYLASDVKGVEPKTAK